MNDKISVKPDTIYLEDLMQDVSEGKYKIPIFQREFVWKPNQMTELFDSILKGYPIGSLLFWKPMESFDTKDIVGPYMVKVVSRDMSYVLDGFQRISTLFGVLTNPKNYGMDTDHPDVKEFLIYFDVRANLFQKIKPYKDKSIYVVPLYAIYDNRELFNLLRAIDNETNLESDKIRFIENARNLHDTLHKYRMPFVQISGGDIKSAVDIFSRINSEGTKISEDFLLSALSYNNESGFLLAETITDILDGFTKYNFKDLKRDTIFNCITNSNGKLYFDVKIEELKDNSKYDLETLALKAIPHIEKTVEFLYKRLNVIDYRYLPYPSQFIFISEYFRLNPNSDDFNLNQLIHWFWTTTYSNYYTNYSLSQQRSAYLYFSSSIIQNGEIKIYKVNENEQFVTLKFPKKIDFTGVRSKALQLFMLRRTLNNSLIEPYESVVEQFIFKLNKDRTRIPANMILRVSSEFEANRDLKDIDCFIRESSESTLLGHFISSDMRNLYISITDRNQEINSVSDRILMENKIENFILLRERFIQQQEKLFVESLGVTYMI